MVKLGILGGTFDPIHNGHLQLAQSARQTLGLDTVVFAPAGDPPHKPARALTPAEHRFKMVALAIADEPGFAVSRVDLDRPGPHFSADMIALVQADYQVGPEETFFIIGADALADLPHWYAPDKLLALCRVAAACRAGYAPDLAALPTQLPSLAQRLVWIEMPHTPVSATRLRRQISRGDDVSGQIPAPALNYLTTHHLYDGTTT